MCLQARVQYISDKHASEWLVTCAVGLQLLWAIESIIFVQCYSFAMPKREFVLAAIIGLQLKISQPTRAAHQI